MNLESAARFVLDEGKKRNIDQFDLIATDSEDTGIEVFKGRISQTETSRSRGLGIRVLVGSRPGYSYSERFSAEALTRMLQDALDQTSITDPLDLDLPEPEELPDLDLKQYDPSLETLGFAWMRELGKNLDEAAWKSDPRIENVPQVGVGKSKTESVIANSKGVFVFRKTNMVYAGTGMVATDGNIKKTGSFFRSGRNLNRLSVSEIVNEAKNRATELLGSKSLSSGVYPVVLSNRISPQIFGMFSSPFFADSVQKGQSRLLGKLGQQIAWNGLSILCEPHLPDFPGSRLIDSEGVLTHPRTVVKNGELSSYLHNLESAKKEGVPPTGNGVRSYSGRAGTAFSNLIVPFGSSTKEELLSAHNHCIYITKLEGGAGCSHVSGEISIGIQGIYYKNGVPQYPVDRITMNTNFFDLLKNIEGISNEYSDTYSSIKVPDVLISDVNIAG
ncbi:Zn-dependent protease [Leptospira perolatii]|uniref:Zn-dependent protease n=1 Tax=Leptospira perolatii TaxID=2023191 RepID=A0A2M9ZJQ7_9LEPT|nr:TldD/PmbA family protein [Leptospira perolatii]PJZ69454.1 Zn-dependent protease [Leptospira perolatii]PJZ72279.1 Zn-dependent protease [Leptospira perolatii]